jgi:hypothetical protein
VVRVNKGGFAPAAGVIQPGVYCGGITLGAGNYTFQPGMYIIAGGGFKIQNNATTATGSGLTFYLTQSSASWGCQSGGSGQNYDGVDINGGNVTFSAPTGGDFVGMLFFQDRSLTPTGYSQIVGNANNITIDGALYFKTSDFKYAGKSSSNGYTVVVADTVSINGTSTIGNNYSSLTQPNPFAPYTTGGGLAE